MAYVSLEKNDMLDNNRRLILTKHAFERINLYKIPIAKLIWLFWNGEIEKLPKDIKRQKYNKYSDRDKIIHIRNGKYIMTVKQTTNNKNGEPIYLMLTVCDQEINLRYADY